MYTVLHIQILFEEGIRANTLSHHILSNKLLPTRSQTLLLSVVQQDIHWCIEPSVLAINAVKALDTIELITLHHPPTLSGNLTRILNPGELHSLNNKQNFKVLKDEQWILLLSWNRRSIMRYIILWQNEHEEGSLSCKFSNPDEGNVS